MAGSRRFFFSIIIIGVTVSCDHVPLSYRLQYQYSTSERDSLSARIEKEINRNYDVTQLQESKFDTLLAISSDNEYYYRRKASSYARIGDFHRAFPNLEKAIQLDPVQALYYSGWDMLYLFRDYERALEQFNFYDDITPGVVYIWGENIHFLKGLAYKQLLRYDEAVQEFDRCIEYEGRGTDIYTFVYRGVALMRNECLEDAILDFDKALSKDPKCTEAWVYKGEALINLNELQRAADCLKQARDLLVRGIKKNHPYVEVFDEVHLEQVEDLLAVIDQYVL